LLFILAAALLVINTIVRQPGRAAVGLGIVLLGAPAYAIWRRRDHKTSANPVEAEVVKA
jgi:APA family basic amino acid/polyamine antiporter